MSAPPFSVRRYQPAQLGQEPRQQFRGGAAVGAADDHDDAGGINTLWPPVELSQRACDMPGDMKHTRRGGVIAGRHEPFHAQEIRAELGLQGRYGIR